MTNRPDEKRARDIAREVQERNGIWDAYDQGRWAFAKGFPIEDNGHVQWHVNHTDWRRGWLVERDGCSAADSYVLLRDEIYGKA